MKRITISFGIALLHILFFNTCTNQNDFPVLKGPYLGQEPPGMTPEVFAPGIISTGFDELFGSFTPDGKEFYYILGGEPIWTILVLKEKNGVWTKPEVTSFSPKYRGKFCLSPDGNKIVLTSLRPLNGKGEPSKKFHTWIVERTKTGWSKPKLIKILEHAFAPSLAANGNMYFFIHHQGRQDLYMSKFLSGRYTEPVSLGNDVNSAQDEFDPFIAPDEKYLMFTSNRTGNNGIYICYKKKDGSWTLKDNGCNTLNRARHIATAAKAPYNLKKRTAHGHRPNIWGLK